MAPVARSEDERGFTLVELMVVVIVLGILAAIAVPTFMNQREKSWKRAAMSDLRGAANVMETFFDDHGSYLAVGGIVPGTTPPYDFRTSGSSAGGVEVSLPVGATTTAIRYCLEADHIKLNGPGTVDYHLDSLVGRPRPGGC